MADSITQVESQPSPLVVFPSSHYSPASKTPSPHFKTHAAPTVGHLYPVSKAQLVQPSPLVKLPSSHVSPP